MLVISDRISEVSAIVNNYFAEHNTLEPEDITYLDYQQHQLQRPLYVRIAEQLARHRRNKHDEQLQYAIEEKIAELNDELPCGSGWSKSEVVEFGKTIAGGKPHTDQYFIIHASYHHYNQAGYALGYSHWEVRVVAEFGGFDINARCRSGQHALKASGDCGFKDFLIDEFILRLNEEK